MKGASGVHQRIVDNLCDRLIASPRVSNIQKNKVYEQGEVDVLTFNEEREVYHFYEIKSRDNFPNYAKATQQYRRYLLAHPGDFVKGVYVTPTKVRRLR